MYRPGRKASLLMWVLAVTVFGLLIFAITREPAEMTAETPITTIPPFMEERLTAEETDLYTEFLNLILSAPDSDTYEGHMKAEQAAYAVMAEEYGVSTEEIILRLKTIYMKGFGHSEEEIEREIELIKTSE